MDVQGAEPRQGEEGGREEVAIRSSDAQVRREGLQGGEEGGVFGFVGGEDGEACGFRKGLNGGGSKLELTAGGGGGLGDHGNDFEVPAAAFFGSGEEEGEGECGDVGGAEENDAFWGGGVGGGGGGRGCRGGGWGEGGGKVGGEGSENRGMVRGRKDQHVRSIDLCTVASTAAPLVNQPPLPSQHTSTHLARLLFSFASFGTPRPPPPALPP